MSRRLLTLLFSTLPTLAGCYACNNVGAPPAFFVTVTSEATGSKVCNAAVTAVTAGQVFALGPAEQSDPQNCHYGDDLLGSSGAYLIVVTAPGFKVVATPASVQTDRCGDYQTQHLALVMKPES